MNIAEECKIIADSVNADKDKGKIHAASTTYPTFIDAIKKAAMRGEYEINLGSPDDCGTYLDKMLEDAGFKVESNKTYLWGSFFTSNYHIWWLE